MLAVVFSFLLLITYVASMFIRMRLRASAEKQTKDIREALEDLKKAIGSDSKKPIKQFQSSLKKMNQLNSDFLKKTRGDFEVRTDKFKLFDSELKNRESINENEYKKFQSSYQTWFCQMSGLRGLQSDQNKLLRSLREQSSFNVKRFRQHTLKKGDSGVTGSLGTSKGSKFSEMFGYVFKNRNISDFGVTNDNKDHV